MPEYKEVKIARILNPTSINLGEYVINPFMGCEFSCLYCYVRGNRVISRKNMPWGEYVDIRVNAPELLEKELAAKKPKIVLLGSTTECFQPVEKQYRLTARLLEILNQRRVRYVILTRSPSITDCLGLLKAGFCEKIYFTVNKFNSEFKSKLEPKSPDFELRDNAVRRLLEEGLPVIPYFSPLLPGISDIREVFSRFEQAESVEFECLNFRLVNICQIISEIGKVKPSLEKNYEKILSDRDFYEQSYLAIQKEIEKQAKIAKKRYNVYIHSFGDYFKNDYSIKT